MRFRQKLLLLLFLPFTLQAASLLERTDCERAAAADAVALVELVLHHGTLVNGQIQTKFVFTTVEPLKGEFPDYFEAHAPGGVYHDVGLADSRLPELTEGSRYVVLFETGERLGFHDGVAGAAAADAIDLAALRACTADTSGADLSAYAREPITLDREVTSSGLSETNGNGFRRFTRPDQGRPIPVIADTSTLPSGITEAQALTALQNALDAWEADTSIRFELTGSETFAKSADDFVQEDGLAIRVQMHDNFSKISNAGSTLGIGGSGIFIESGGGATVAGTPFNPCTYGYVVLEHTQASLSDPVTLEEVIAHELGHAIGLAHSSEDGAEPDPQLADALMYFRAHKDGRGASLGSYDIATVLQSHPADTPPWGFDRVIDAVTFPDSYSLANLEVNQVSVAGADLQGDSLSYQFEKEDFNAGGSFSLAGETLTYTPGGFFNAGPVPDPETQFYDRYTFRISDGTNLSPFIDVRVISFNTDTAPAGSVDGVPDAWMSDHFGSASGSTAGVDPDGDGLTNLREFLLGTDPNDANSRFQVVAFDENALEWSSQRFDNYRVESTDDLHSPTWVFEALVTQDEADATFIYRDLPAFETSAKKFYRVKRLD